MESLSSWKISNEKDIYSRRVWCVDLCFIKTICLDQDEISTAHVNIICDNTISTDINT